MVMKRLPRTMLRVPEMMVRMTYFCVKTEYHGDPLQVCSPANTNYLSFSLMEIFVLQDYNIFFTTQMMIIGF